MASIITRTITRTDGTSVTALAYQYRNAPNLPSGDWLYLSRSAGWVLIPHYNVADVTPGDDD